jgi:hypothetical protein
LGAVHRNSLSGGRNLEMALIRVEIEQFEWEGNVLIHLPTGAAFAWQNGNTRTGAVTTEWGKAADVLANGDEFDPSEIDILARHLMKEHEGAAI